MNHTEAIETHAAERYLLGELAGEQRDAFEEHFFDCTDCAADVTDDATLVAGVRTGARDANPFLARRAARSRNFKPAYAIAASLFVALLAYQQLGIIRPLRRELELERAPGKVAVYTLRDSRADSRVTINAPLGRFTLDVDIPPTPAYPSYTCTIKDASGKTRVSLPISAAEARETVHLDLHGSTLGSGDYKLEVTGAGAHGEPVITYDFTLQ